MPACKAAGRAQQKHLCESRCRQTGKRKLPCPRMAAGRAVLLLPKVDWFVSGAAQNPAGRAPTGQRSVFPPCVNAASPQFAGRLSFCPRADVSRSRPPAGQQQSPARAALWAVFCSRSYSAGGRKPVCAFFLTVPSVVPAGTHRSPGGFIGCALHTHPAKRCPAISRRARCPGGRTVFVL